MNEDPISDIEIMINRMIDGELDPDQQTALEKRLLRDPQAHAMLRELRSTDDECRNAIGAALAAKPQTAAHPNGAWRAAIVAAAVAAAIVVAVVLWAALAPDPNPSRMIADGAGRQAPTTVHSAELAVDRFDPTPPRQVITRPVRRIDRIPVGLYDPESGQMRIILIDRQQEHTDPQWLDL